MDMVMSAHLLHTRHVQKLAEDVDARVVEDLGDERGRGGTLGRLRQDEKLIEGSSLGHGERGGRRLGEDRKAMSRPGGPLFFSVSAALHGSARFPVALPPRRPVGRHPTDAASLGGAALPHGGLIAVGSVGTPCTASVRVHGKSDVGAARRAASSVAYRTRRSARQ
mgnify:CR=1 FL=1